MIKVKKTTTNALIAVLATVLMTLPATAHSVSSDGTVHADGNMEPSAPEGFDSAIHAGQPPVGEVVLPVIPGDLEDEAAGIQDLLTQSTSTQAASTCTFDNGSGSGGIEYVRTYIPFDAGGAYTTHNNNWVKWFYICRTTWSDDDGMRYVFVVTKDRQNSGVDNHVQSTKDYYDTGYYTANHNKMEPNVPHGERFVDADPEAPEKYVGDGETVHFNIGYGGASVGWSHTFNDGAIKTDDYGDDRVHWHTNTHNFWCCGESSWTSTYGVIQSVPEGTYAQTFWWAEMRWHHLDGSNNHAHRLASPCLGGDCTWNKISTQVGASSSGDGGGGNGGDVRTGTGSGGTRSSSSSSSSYDTSTSNPCAGYGGYRDMGSGYCYDGQYYAR